MINACCNLYFCFIITVHGDIRHLEIQAHLRQTLPHVHGDIRHLEKAVQEWISVEDVHGDIRHLENTYLTR